MKNLFKKIVVSILAFETRMVLSKYKPKIIAITGSVGKTSTKDAIYQVLKDSISTRKSEKSYNSEIGVPLTVLGLKNAWSNPFAWLLNFVKGFLLILFPYHYPKVLVLEAGVGKPGDMDMITSFIQPDIAVVTRLADVPVHVEYFKTPEALYREKGKLVQALKKSGSFIYCGDDGRVTEMTKLTDAKKSSYGFGSENKMVGTNPEIIYEKRLGGLEVPTGLMFRIDSDGKSFPLRLYGTLGRSHMYSVLAALSVGLIFDLNFVEMTKRFETYTTPPGRMRLLEGIKNTTIVDDSYNSSPVAVRSLFESIDALRTAGRKIVVLGDMLELGKYSIDEHKKVGTDATRTADILVTVGKRARDIAEGALNAEMNEKNILQFENSREAGLYLQNFIQEGDIIAVKGSQGSGEDTIRMEKVVQEIMAHPEERQHLLVRQDKEWKLR